MLVGDYTEVEDRSAQKTLEKLKFAQPDCLDIEKRTKEGKPDSRTLGAMRAIQQAMLADNSPKKKRGPMRNAFITTNPLLPDEYFVPQGVDRLVLDMNEPVKYSLLDCPGKYTVKVATFTGASSSIKSRSKTSKRKASPSRVNWPTPPTRRIALRWRCGKRGTKRTSSTIDMRVW